VVDASVRASAAVEITPAGAVHWAFTGEAGWAGSVNGIHIHHGNASSNGLMAVDLTPGGLSFDPTTHTAEGNVTISAALATEIATDPSLFYLDVHTPTAPQGLARGQLAAFTSAQWHATLLGSEETPPAPAARGAASLLVGGDLTLSYVIAMSSPSVSQLTNAHVHAGATGVPGPIFIDLGLASGVVDTTVNTVTGTAPFSLNALAQIGYGLSGFYVNVHTAAQPNGAARGQLSSSTVEMWAPLRGDRETVVVNGSARGAATLSLDTFTSGRAIFSVPPSVGIGSVLSAQVHSGFAGTDGPALVNLTAGADYGIDVPSSSAEGAIAFNQAVYTRLLANPGAYYVNLTTAAAPGGLVREQLTQTPQTVVALLQGGLVVPPASVSTSGHMRIVFDGIHHGLVTIDLTNPDTSTIDGAHLHDGATGATGPILIDLLGGTFVNSGTSITGDASFSGRTAARVIANAAAFYGDVHTPAAIAGAARGQFLLLTEDSAPAGLSYTSPVTYVTGSAITPNVPSSIGGAVTSYGVSPALPAGLTLNTTTGVISGTPTVVTAAATYTVTATNGAGSTTTGVNITVNVGPPTNLQYTTPVTYVVGIAATANTPTNQGGAIASYGVSPALPAGLALNTSTGVISGTPTTAAAAANYTVTGTNTAGSTQATVNITVSASLQPPSNLTYTTPVTYTTGTAITNNTPSYSGGTPSSWSISAALPSGLSFSTSTGVISGTPTAVASQTTYTVTATNAAGSTQGSVQITVALGAPTNLSYSNNPGIGYVSTGQFPTMSPTSSGGAVASYAITAGGALPAGITLNTSTGVISGTPTATTSGIVTYTVTATNAAGSTTATVQIYIY
jgi:hypothetical protein